MLFRQVTETISLHPIFVDDFVSLNSRQHVRNQADNEPNSISINLSSLAAAEPVQNGTNGRLKISAPLSESTAEGTDQNYFFFGFFRLDFYSLFFCFY